MHVSPEYIEKNYTQATSYSKAPPANKRNKQDNRMIEGILALYKVTPLGGLQRNTQVDIKMGRHF